MTNRDHSPSVSQNDGGDAKSSREGSGLGLDALEAVARAATTASSMPSLVWAKCPTTCSEGVDRCVAAGKCLREGTPYRTPGCSLLTIGPTSPAPPAVDPATVLRLIQTQRELVAALSELRAVFRDPLTRRALGGHNDAQVAAMMKASAALSHQPPRAPDEPGDRAREAGKSLPEGDA